MPVLLQICAVIVTTALVAIAVVTVRTMLRFEKAAEEFTETTVLIRDSIDQFQSVTRETHELIESLSDIVPSVRRTASRLEMIGERTARLSSAVLEEVETPIRTAVAVARGVRAGTSRLVERLTQRFAHRSADHNGGYEHA